MKSFALLACLGAACGGGTVTGVDSGPHADASSGFDLAGADLAGVDLAGVDFSAPSSADLSMGPVAGEPPTLTGITAAHNSARAQAMPAPSPALPALTWSGTLAQAAQTWADGCVFQHSMGMYGENLYASAGSTPTGPGVTQDWVSEASSYEHATDSCSGVCGHYTQVVWRATSMLGCAVKACSQNSPFGGYPDWTIVVCEYDPPGNYVGQKPY